MPSIFEDLYDDYLKNHPFPENSFFNKNKRQAEDEEWEARVKAIREAELKRRQSLPQPRYGSTIYFVFLDNTLNILQRRKVVENANKILQLNSIHAQVVGLKPLKELSKDECDFPTIISQNSLAQPFTSTLKVTDRVVWIMNKESQGNMSLGADATGYTPNGVDSYVHVSAFKQWSNDRFASSDNLKGFDLEMHIARTAIHEMTHQILLRGRENVHTWQGDSWHYNKIEIEKMKVNDDYSSMDEKWKSRYLLKLINSAENTYRDYSPYSWQRKADDRPTSNTEQPPYYNIMSDGDTTRVRYPSTKKTEYTMQRMCNTYLMVDSFITQLFFKLGLGLPQGLGDSRVFAEYLMHVQLLKGITGVKEFYSFVMASEQDNSSMTGKKHRLGNSALNYPLYFTLEDKAKLMVPITIKDTFNYQLNRAIQKV